MQHPTLLEVKSVFGVREVLVVGHIYGPYGQKPSIEKVDMIQRIKECKNTIEVRRFLGVCIFYCI